MHPPPRKLEEEARSMKKKRGGGGMGRRRWWLGWWWSDRCTISGEQSRISNPPRCRMLERGWVAGLPVYPSSWFSQRCKSIHIPGRKLCLSRWKKYLRRRRRRGECLCRGGRGWRKVIWILIKLLWWFRWLLKQVCFGVDSGYESAERVWMSLYGNTMIDFEFVYFHFYHSFRWNSNAFDTILILIVINYVYSITRWNFTLVFLSKFNNRRSKIVDRVKTESNFIPCVYSLQLRVICHNIRPTISNAIWEVSDNTNLCRWPIWWVVG